MRVSASDGGYLRIEPVSSREQYRWMGRFIPMVEEPNLRNQLSQAIDGKGAFRRFKDDAHGVWPPSVSAGLRFVANGCGSSWRRGSPRAVSARWRAHRVERRASQRRCSRSRRIFPERTTRRYGADLLRKQLKEIAETLSARDLEKVAAFAEFVKARRAAQDVRSPLRGSER